MNPYVTLTLIAAIFVAVLWILHKDLEAAEDAIKELEDETGE